MRQITKLEEPKAFILWKEAKNETISRYIEEEKSGDDIWGLLQSSLSKEAVSNDYSKAQLRASLATEQHYICCYCNDTIKAEPLDTKIEHYLPKDAKEHKSKIFEYQNLFAACNGGERVIPRELSCDSHKGHNEPTSEILSPLETDPHLHFLYRENGKVEGKTQRGNNTISFFNLDCKRLRLRRKTVFEEYLYDEGSSFSEQILELSQPINGKLKAFCTATISVLEAYL